MTVSFTCTKCHVTFPYLYFLYLSLIFIALGFGIHIAHLLQRLQNFTRPSVSCGWDCGSIVRHVHVLVNKPNGGFYSSVNVRLPHEHLDDVFRRVSFLY